MGILSREFWARKPNWREYPWIGRRPSVRSTTSVRTLAPSGNSDKLRRESVFCFCEAEDGCLNGKLFGDKGYISAKLFAELWEQGVQLVTQIRSNMKNRLMPMIDKLLLRKRSLIETVNDQLKNIAQLKHTRHRSVNNFMVNLVAALISYCHQPKKPSPRLEQLDHEIRKLAAPDGTLLLKEY